MQNMDTISCKPNVLELQGAYNVRDLGGYLAADGKNVCFGKVFRSGDLNKLTDADLQVMEKIPIKSCVDFRSQREVERAPDRRPESLKQCFMLNIDPGSIISMQSIKEGKGEEAMLEINRLLVRDFQNIYTEFFSILQNIQNTPLLFHCSAGKDRVGYGSALFLSALGVDKKNVLEDYMFSGPCLKDKYAKMIEEHPNAAPMLIVKPSYLNAALELIDSEYGGMEKYLTQNLKVNLELMRDLYTC